MVLPWNDVHSMAGWGWPLTSPHPLWWSSIKVSICLVWLHHCKSLHYVMLNSNHCWECHFLYFLSQSTQDAITKYHRCKGSNNRNFFITVLEGWEAQDQGARRFCSRWKPTSCLAASHLPTVSSHCNEEREWALGLSSSSHKDTNLLTGAPLSWPHLNLITYQRSQLQISSRCGDARSFNIRILGEHKHSWVHNTFTVGLSNPHILQEVQASFLWKLPLLIEKELIILFSC